MSVKSVDTDYDNLTLTLVAEFDAPPERVWELWADPRKLERWWGPPSYPATFETHDLTPGGEATYYMTGPEGDKPRGWWRITSVDPPTSLEFTDGFANDDGTPNPAMPETKVEVRLTEFHRRVVVGLDEPFFLFVRGNQLADDLLCVAVRGNRPRDRLVRLK